MLQPSQLLRSGRACGVTLLLSASLITTMLAAKPSPAPSKKSANAKDNPLLSESTLPFHYPPFDKIKNEDFSPAYAAALAEHLKEVEAIANQKDEATFDNTLVAMERTGRTLDRIDNIFSNLAGAHTNPVLQKTEAEMAPKLSAHRDAILA